MFVCPSAARPEVVECRDNRRDSSRVQEDSRVTERRARHYGASVGDPAGLQNSLRPTCVPLANCSFRVDQMKGCSRRLGPESIRNLQRTTHA